MKSKGRRITGIILLSLVVLLSVTLLGGCALGPSSQQPTPGESALNQSSPTAKTPIYVVIDADPTSSTSAMRQAAFQTVVDAAWRSRAMVMLATAGTGHVKIVFSALAVAGGGSYLHPFKQRTAGAVMAKHFLAAERSVAGSVAGSVDLLGTLRSLEADLHGIGGRVSVLIMSSGLQRTAPLNLVSNPQLLNDPATTAATLTKANIMPRLPGWSIAFLAPEVSSGWQQQQLTALWYHLITSAGAKMDGLLSAVLSWPLTPIATPPQAANLMLIPGGSGKLTVRVPDRVLFRSGQALLLPAARSVIAEMSTLMKHYPNSTAQVLGYCDDVGTKSFNLALSQKRAAAVAAALEADGILARRLTIKGLGSSHYLAANTSPQGRAKNRRVDLVIHTTSPR